MSVKYCYEFCNMMYVISYEQKKVIREEPEKGKIINLKIHAEVNKTNEKNVSKDEMLSQIKGERLFKISDTKDKLRDTRYMLLEIRFQENSSVKGENVQSINALMRNHHL